MGGALSYSCDDEAAFAILSDQELAVRCSRGFIGLGVVLVPRGWIKKLRGNL